MQITDAKRASPPDSAPPAEAKVQLMTKNNQLTFGNDFANLFMQQRGPSVISAIQAVDQYGNILATAQNPSAPQIMQQPKMMPMMQPALTQGVEPLKEKP